MIRSLTSLRFLFILLIVLFHIVGQRFEFGGDCGVSFFLMLSGFVLSYAYGQKVLDGSFRTLSFVRRQLVKFYPLHLLMLVVMVLLDARLGRFYEWYQLLPSIFLVQSWFPFDRIIRVANASSWFLCALLFSYVVFAAAFRLLHRVSVPRLLVWAVVLTAIYGVVVFSVPVQKVNYVVCLSPLMRVIDFCIGVLVFRLCSSRLGDAVEQRVQAWATWKTTLLELLPVAVVVLSYFVYEAVSPRWRCASLFWIVLPPLLFVYVKTERQKGLLTAFLHWPVMVWLGGISMEIYLTHWPVMRMLNSLLHSAGMYERLPFTAIVVLSILVMVAVAYVFHRWFVLPVQLKLSTYVL